MASCAVIACDNGYGHVRRCILICNALAASGVSATLFAPLAAVRRFNKSDNVTVIDFETKTSVDGLRRGDADCRFWERRLPPLDTFDLVVSDNLPEILRLRPDAVLSGSFLWHLALDGVSSNIANEAKNLLAEHRPVMVASELFGQPGLSEWTRLFSVGLCTREPASPPHGENLLIACGGTAAIEDDFRAFVSEIANGSPPAFPVVWVEPRLLPQHAPDWMRKAEFGQDLYNGLAAAICRPGVGTLTDCLCAGARVFAIWEPGNGEMAFNARRLTEVGVGEAATDLRTAYAAAQSFVADRDRRRAQNDAIGRLDFDGVTATVAILAKVKSGSSCAA